MSISISDAVKCGRIIVDPELVLPSREGMRDESFWLRFSYVADYPFAKLSQECSEKFVDIADKLMECADGLGVGAPDLDRAIDSVWQMDTFDAAQTSRSLQLSEEEYVSRFGDPDDVAMLCDELVAGNGNSRLVLSDKFCWLTASQGEVHKGKHTIIIFDAVDRTPLVSQLEAVYGGTFACLERVAPDAFPNVLFGDRFWESTHLFQGKERDNVRALTIHLAALNALPPGVWNQNNNRAVQSAMKSMGVKCSPETQETMNKKKCREQRTFFFGGKPVVMSWHTKIVHDTGRMYFQHDGSSRKMLVGGCTDHFGT